MDVPSRVPLSPQHTRLRPEQVLAASSNQITEPLQGLGGLRSLVELYLNGNRLCEFPEGLFDEAGAVTSSELRHINISSNRLTLPLPTQLSSLIDGCMQLKVVT